jgi:hypothetical protein
MKEMKITDPTPYPTIGEVLLTAFKWSGLWDYLGSDAKLKTVQKKLQRFASEETLLTHDEIEELICKSLYSAVPHKTLGFVVARLFVLLMDGYRQIMRENATWLDRKETGRWFFRCELVMPLVMNLQRAKMIFRPEHDPEYVYHFPEELFWFLPEKTNGDWEMPLQKVMRWWLAVNKFTPLENITGATASAVRKWMNSKAKPYVSTLKEIEKANLGLPYDEANMKRSLTLCVIISNLVSHFFDSMRKLVGDDDVEQFLADFRAFYEAHENNEMEEFRQWVTPEIEKGRENGAAENCPQDEMMMGEFLALNDWEEIFHSEIFYPRMKDVFSVVHQTKSIRCLQKNNFVCEAGRHYWKSQQEVVENYFDATTKQLLCDAERLRMKVDKGGPSARVEAQAALPSFRKRCEAHGEGLNFYPEYLDARLATYAVAYADALAHYHQAFHAARYRGGGVMKNGAEEYLIIGSYLYSHQAKYGIKVQKNLLKYLHKWICLMYPKSDWVECNNDDYIEFAQAKFNRV